MISEFKMVKYLRLLKFYAVYFLSNISGFAVQNIHHCVHMDCLSLVVTELLLEILLMTSLHQGLCLYGPLIFALTMIGYWLLYFTLVFYTWPLLFNIDGKGIFSLWLLYVIM